MEDKETFRKEQKKQESNSVYLSSFVSFFLVVFTLATVSRTAWSPQGTVQIQSTRIMQRMRDIIHNSYTSATALYQPAAQLHCCWSFQDQPLPIV